MVKFSQDDYIKVNKMNKEINYLKIEPTKRTKKETILMFHGWGSSIDSQVALGKELSNLGFAIVIPEIKYHDSRGALKNHFDKVVLQKYFWKTIFESIDEQKELLFNLNLKSEEIILFGSSMGGFIASGMFFSKLEFTGLININGSSSFIATELDFRKLDNKEMMNKDQLLQFKHYDPKYKELSPTQKILFMHGENDQTIPIVGQNEFLSHYKNLFNENQLDFFTYKDVNHTITVEMKKDLLMWLAKNY